MVRIEKWVDGYTEDEKGRQGQCHQVNMENVPV